MTLSKQIVVVFGATGSQGGSVVNTFLEDPELSKKYHIRAVSRDVNKPEAKALQLKGAEVVQGDADEPESLPRIFQGAHTAFLATFTVYDEQLQEREWRQGKALVDAAVAASVDHIVFSTLPPASVIANHKYAVTAFDSKYAIEQYIRSLPIKSSFFAPGSFMQNLFGFLRPRPVGDGTFVITTSFHPTTELPLIDTFADSGKWVATLIEHRDEHLGQVVSAATRLYSLDEIVQTVSRVSGKTVRFQEMTPEEFRTTLPYSVTDPLVAMNRYFVDYGYFGPETKTLVEASAKLAWGAPMSKQIFVVFGATGNQGGSIVNTFLQDPELSKKYHIRAVTRDLNKPDAKALQSKGAEVVQGDADDAESLPRVLHGAHTVFIATFTVYDEQLQEREFRQGKVIADAAVTAGVHQIVFSSLPPASAISNYKYAVTAFDSKYAIEQYIRTLPVKSAFFAPGSFMQNLHSWLLPKPAGDGTFVVSAPYKPTTELPLIDTFADSGKWVATLVENPKKYDGQVVSAATRLYTLNEVVETISRVTGKTVKFREISPETYKSFLPPAAAGPLTAMNEYDVEFGYYGPETKTLVEASAKLARGELTTLEQYLRNNPLPL
ncbi:hypothetical protein BGZ83_005220 [Gryganskiella cystojenkinii]|nr:hypothetical protein BGZ83_005220 [Gryganskiella cystojenkinii]